LPSISIQPFRSLKIHITGTGTSQGIPVIGCECPVCRSDDPRDNRLRTAAVVDSGDTSVAIDIGPDFRMQMLRANVHHLHGILITHEHNDHVAGLDDVRPFNFLQKVPMKIFAEKEVNRILERRFDYIFKRDGYPGRPSLELVDIEPGNIVDIGNIEVLPLRISHGRSDILGFKIGSLSYITDAKMIPDEVIPLVYGCEVIVLNALRHTEHHSHLTLQQAIDLSDRLSAKSTYLTHISHQLGKHADVETILPSGVHLAYDGLTLTL